MSREPVPTRSDPQGSLARFVGNAPMGEAELRLLAARALQAGVIVFVRADLARLNWHDQQIIETAAKRLYG